MNDALRVREGRPRGAPGRRRDLHGRRAGDDRPGRLAAERVPDARRRAVLGRHLLPAAAAPRAAVVAQRAGRRSRDAWVEQRDEIDRRRRRRSCRGCRARRRWRRRTASCRPTLLDAVGRRCCGRSFDGEHGGWGARAEVPGLGAIEFLLARGETAMPLQTLRRMAAGGIYDQIGGGFARYSVDARWLVPHFEKMLYDNALLARAYLHAFQVSGDAAVPAGVRGDARLGDARAAPGRGRVRLVPGRRLRGRRGQVLRLDAGRDRRGAWATSSGRSRSRISASPRQGTSRARTSSCGRRRTRRELADDQGGAAGGARRAGAAGAGRQAADVAGTR